MSQQPSAGWHADPSGRFQFRYWDGARWSEHVATNGQQGIDPLAGPAAQRGEGKPPEIPESDVEGLKRASDEFYATKTPAELKIEGQEKRDAQVADIGFPSVRGTKAVAAEKQAADLSNSPTAANPPLSANRRPSKKIQKQIEKAGLVDTSGTAADREILNQPVLVINQRGKLVELRAEYAIFDQNGLQLAAVRGRRLSSRMEVVDMNGRAVLELRRESSILGSKVVVSGAAGARVGRIVPSVHINKVDRAFKLEGPTKEVIGEVYVEDDRRPRNVSRRNREFNVQDRSGTVVARIAKTRAGLAKELFTKGDNYVVQFLDPSIGSLRSLVIAASLVIDTEFHQK